MFIIDETATFIQEIKKSRFRALAAPLRSEDEAKSILRLNVDPQASHNCWAWRIGQSYRFNDDGEPSGTAGKPILQAIDGQSIDNVIVIVTRWFGGVLLGSGGLVRAYGGSAASCLRSAEKSLLVAVKSFEIDLAFTDLAIVEARLSSVENSRIRAKEFHARGARLIVDIPDNLVSTVSAIVSDITSGRALISELD